MIEIKKPVYQCSYCKRKKIYLTKTGCEKHEAICFQNPHRICPECGDNDITRESLDWIQGIISKTIDGEEYTGIMTGFTNNFGCWNCAFSAAVRCNLFFYKNLKLNDFIMAFSNPDWTEVDSGLSSFEI